MFICKAETEAKKSKPTKLTELKQLVDKIEDELSKPAIPICFPLIPPCPPPQIPEYHQSQFCPPCIPILPEERAKSKPPKPVPLPPPPEIMVCYKSNARNVKNGPRRLHRAKSRELRAGILYRGCDCEKLNGLQDDCRRTGCQGSPECLTKPDPICGPSEFSNGKHLGVKRDVVDGETGEVTTQYNCYPAVVAPI